MDVWFHRFHNPHLPLPGETFPRGGYVGVPDGYVYYWPHAESWENIPKKGGKAEGRGAEGSSEAGIKTYMSKKLSEVELRQAIAKLVVNCDLPFKIVEAEAKNFIPSRWTVARNTVAFAAAALHAAKAELQGKEGELGCKVWYTIDIWTAPNGKAWLVVTGHWIDESFQLCEAVFEFRELPGRHGAAQIVQIMEDTVVMWGLEGRCLGLTTDNASANIAAYRRLSEEGGGRAFFNSCLHFRCVSHVVNLAVQAGLKVEAIRALLKVLRDMASWVGYSPQGSAAFLGLQRGLNQQARVKKPALKLVQDSPIRWGSTHAMIERFLELENSITVFLASTQGLAKEDKEKVEKMRLSDEQWGMLRELKFFLSPFNKVSKAAEGTAYPTLSMVVPYYNGLIDAMEARLAKGTSALLKPLV
ncbi:unnamed protein product [Closterium sp. Naga37s-1]|nr:unnamed protein product [Closterium sp. Naga37s-1]